MGKQAESLSIETMSRTELETRIKNLEAGLAYHRKQARQSTDNAERTIQIRQASGVSDELIEARAAFKARFLES